MKVLLISFGEFIASDGTMVRKNIGQEIVGRILAGWQKNDCQVLSLRLPVDPEIVKSSIKKIIEVYEPNFAFCFGHAKGYNKLTIETRYFNTFTPRTDKEKKYRGPIEITGADYYSTRFVGLNMLSRRIIEQGIPVFVHGSRIGMDYLCNFTAYYIHFLASQRSDGLPNGLLFHIPPKETMPLDASAAGVKIAIDYLI